MGVRGEPRPWTQRGHEERRSVPGSPAPSQLPRAQDGQRRLGRRVFLSSDVFVSGNTWLCRASRTIVGAREPQEPLRTLPQFRAPCPGLCHSGFPLLHVGVRLSPAAPPRRPASVGLFCQRRRRAGRAAWGSLRYHGEFCAHAASPSALTGAVGKPPGPERTRARGGAVCSCSHNPAQQRRPGGY